ncbi:tetratricopeptide repeat protein [Leptospira meyeri]|uniref:tetratricopeptide repeat protein n=1 Tax=Leptospira meyeri TaxID=29508 RepID=UPI000C2B14BD|nr:hypothetical protein [Leptospira meyeri]PJZ80711.1 hypothetical protein CH359_10035 [Leptospira meyeri]PJZ96214.1 hypothetical protein CH358_11705 [Leptospira meyeri]PKA11819.1 hypothetical protein CH372_12190 [Leptospira meyeri]
MKPLRIYLLILFIFIGFGISLNSEPLSETNQKAIDAFYQKNWSQAEIWFKESLKKNPNDPYANYNLACVYTILLSQCEYLTEEQDVFQLLTHAVKNKKSYKSLMLKDKDLSLLRNTYRFNEIAGLSPKEIFTNIFWFGPSPGAYGPVSEIKFDANGSFELSLVEFRESDGALEKPKFKGKYQWISEDKIQLEFQNLPSAFPNQIKKRQARWNKDKLEIDGFEYQFVDSPDRCSA